MNRTLAGQWASYSEQVLPATAGPIQVSEMRRAFYAGAAAMLDGVTCGLDPSPEPTDGDVAKLEALHQELLQFGRDLKEGRA